MSLENLLNNGQPSAEPSSPATQPATTDQQVTASETAEKPAPAEPDLDLGFGRKFSALSRKEKELREMKKQIEEERKAIQAGSNQYNEFKRKLKLSPLEALQEAGVDIDYITNAHLSGGKVPESVLINSKVEELQATIEALQAKLEGKKPEVEAESEVDPDDESNWTPEQKEAVQVFKQGMYEYLDQQQKSYPLIHEQEAAEVVYHAINELYKQSAKQGNPRIPSYEEAASKVEQWLQSEIKRLAGRVQEPVESQGQGSKQVSTQQGSSVSPTLSNQHSSSRPTEAQGSRLLTREESLARAAAMLKHL